MEEEIKNGDIFITHGPIEPIQKEDVDIAYEEYVKSKSKTEK